MLKNFYQALPKMRFRNVSDKVIPPFGVMLIVGADPDGTLQCSYHVHQHAFWGDIRFFNEVEDEWQTYQSVFRVHHTPSHIEYIRDAYNDECGGEHFSIFNLQSQVQPGKTGLCTSHLPTIVRCKRGLLDDINKHIAVGKRRVGKNYGNRPVPFDAHHGVVVCPKQHSYEVQAGVAGEIIGQDRYPINGWPIIGYVIPAKIARTSDLKAKIAAANQTRYVVIGGVPSYEHTGHQTPIMDNSFAKLVGHPEFLPSEELPEEE